MDVGWLAKMMMRTRVRRMRRERGKRMRKGRVWISLVLVASGVTATREVVFDWRRNGEFTVDGRE